MSALTWRKLIRKSSNEKTSSQRYARNRLESEKRKQTRTAGRPRKGQQEKQHPIHEKRRHLPAKELIRQLPQKRGHQRSRSPPRNPQLCRPGNACCAWRNRRPFFRDEKMRDPRSQYLLLAKPDTAFRKL